MGTTDREAVVWTRCGSSPSRVGRLIVTDTQCRFTYEEEFLRSGLPGIGILYDPRVIASHTIAWDRTEHFNLLPQLQFLIPPRTDSNFQRRLVLSYLEKQERAPAPGFDSDWSLLMVAGHGGVGHLDVFGDDEKAVAWYDDQATPALFTIADKFGFSLKEFLTWLDDDAEALLEALGPTPSVGGAIPKLLLSIPAAGWDGRIALPTRGYTDSRTNVVLKFEKDSYPGIVELEALTLDVHREAGFQVPRYWLADIAGVPAIAIERFDRDENGKPRFMETVYSVMATASRRITDNHSSSYDEIGLLLDRSPIAVVSDPGQGKQYLLKRLLMAFVTGNGDLHMENMSLLQRNGKVEFSPVYDPTPMRAYNRHNMLVPMPFGDYGEYAGSDQPVDFETALLQLTRSLGVSRPKLRAMIEEVLAVTKDYTQRVAALVSLPDNNRKLLIGVSEMIRKKLEKF